MFESGIWIGHPWQWWRWRRR